MSETNLLGQEVQIASGDVGIACRIEGEKGDTLLWIARANGELRCDYLSKCRVLNTNRLSAFKPEAPRKISTLEARQIEQGAEIAARDGCIDALASMLERGWGIIANSGGGDWATETMEWQHAAAKWRDDYLKFTLPGDSEAKADALAKLVWYREQWELFQLLPSSENIKLRQAGIEWMQKLQEAKEQIEKLKKQVGIDEKNLIEAGQKLEEERALHEKAREGAAELLRAIETDIPKCLDNYVSGGSHAHAYASDPITLEIAKAHIQGACERALDNIQTLAGLQAIQRKEYSGRDMEQAVETARDSLKKEIFRTIGVTPFSLDWPETIERIRNNAAARAPIKEDAR